ncbi:hypothetical protein AAG570_012948 [Ranatra chinensis]|uniref:Potassium channel domain-containing protein n=1 Tax=Ranatra chinensis TaxID=642074 RepID=A0ABD0YFC3_9HEMI
MRDNVTEDLWSITKEMSVLHQENWTTKAISRIKLFENDLVLAIRKAGWDGSEEVDSLQWTFAGALFYSIIVITTIGYGHIAPKTHLGKVTTIFYAIVGIPLMLLCLSNIGDIMAHSFRFLYWRICCYACTRDPKRNHSTRRRAKSIRISNNGGYSDYGDEMASNQTKPVPIWLCVFLVVSYIIGGAFLFSDWEDWGYADSAYFCFITLTTIGFGDFVPAQRVNKKNGEMSIALCSLYLLFGIALLAMSFNLVQEEVINNVKAVARHLGIIKDNTIENNPDYVE